MHDERGGRRGGLFEEGVEIFLPLWAGDGFRGAEGDARIEIVKELVDLLDLVVGWRCGPKVSERYWRRQRHALRLRRAPACWTTMGVGGDQVGYVSRRSRARWDRSRFALSRGDTELLKCSLCF
jgi:hypothetical protein